MTQIEMREYMEKNNNILLRNLRDELFQKMNEVAISYAVSPDYSSEDKEKICFGISRMYEAVRDELNDLLPN